MKVAKAIASALISWLAESGRLQKFRFHLRKHSMGSGNSQNMLAQIVLRCHVNLVTLLKGDGLFAGRISRDGFPFFPSDSGRAAISAVYRSRLADFLTYASQDLEISKGVVKM
jgi:hypothetical protein